MDGALCSVMHVGYTALSRALCWSVCSIYCRCSMNVECSFNFLSCVWSCNPFSRSWHSICHLLVPCFSIIHHSASYGIGQASLDCAKPLAGGSLSLQLPRPEVCLFSFHWHFAFCKRRSLFSPYICIACMCVDGTPSHSRPDEAGISRNAA